jgi:hypothetical protein
MAESEREVVCDLCGKKTQRQRGVAQGGSSMTLYLCECGAIFALFIFGSPDVYALFRLERGKKWKKIAGSVPGQGMAPANGSREP